MTNKTFLRKIAEEYNTTPDEVLREIQLAIDEAMNNPDPEIRRNWENIPCKGDKPSPEEVIAYISSEVGKRRGLS
ncbi:MAG: sporulation initiation factor Spo0A C-terminal domain-containing protein [Ruminococcus flavefaciens]|nr:sporulation initiation factor Spo0A C-terminal domain-containing protein [Ruminococcus flavefaciens]MCM1230545.1 sporulation initiation factor Spo0A C-terminal domain-containing protein [Ruminococcus flavefaciens]